MKKTVQAILERLDRQAIDAQLASLVEKENRLEQTEAALSDSRDKTPMLDRLNPFKTTDAEREIKRHKTERDEIQHEATRIRRQLNAVVLAAIADEPKAQLAISLGELDKKIKEMESGVRVISSKEFNSDPNDGTADKLRSEERSLDSLQNSLRGCRTSLDDLAHQLRVLVGVETGSLTEQSLVDATLKKLR